MNKHMQQITAGVKDNAYRLLVEKLPKEPKATTSA